MTWSRLSPTWKSILVLTALLVGGIVACGSATPSAQPLPIGPTPTVTAPTEMPVVISMAGRFRKELAVLDEQIATFEAENPDIRVEIVTSLLDGSQGPSSDRHQMYTSLLSQGDSSVDVYAIDDTWLPEFAAQAWIAPVDSYVKSQGIDTERILPGALETGRIDGQLMALPWTAGAGLLYYRHDLLDSYEHRPPTTWGELQKIALDVKSKENLPYGYVWQGAAYESLTCNTLEFVWAYGGDVLDQDGSVIFDSPQTHTALQAMADLLETGTSPVSVTSFYEDQALTAFQAGESVFMRNWAYAWTILNSDDSPVRGQVSVMPPPASCQIGQSLVLSAYSLHAEEAFRLMAFLVDYEQQVQLAISTDQPPALETAYDDAGLLEAEPFFDDLHAALSASRPRPRSHVYRTLSQAIYTEVNKMLSGGQDVQATTANIQRRIEAAFTQP